MTTKPRPCPGSRSKVTGRHRTPCIRCDRRIESMTVGLPIKPAAVYVVERGEWECGEQVDLFAGGTAAEGAQR